MASILPNFRLRLHAGLFVLRWPVTTATRFEYWLGLFLVIACAGFASQVRLNQLSAWDNDPETFMASGVPMMTTLDAYYALRIARRFAAGTYASGQPATQRHYDRPSTETSSGWYEQREPYLPLLSGVIGVLSPLFGHDVDRTGLLLSPMLSSLFMLPLFLCCSRLGVPAAGLMGGLAGTFCIEYFNRSGAGWVATDALNLFFLWMTSYFMLSLRKAQALMWQVLWCAAAGATLYVFFRWYWKPGLTLLYIAALVLHLALAGVSWRRNLLCTATLAVCASPFQLDGALISIEGFVRRYVGFLMPLDDNNVPGFQFAAVWPTITEVGKLHWKEVLGRVMPQANAAAIGLLVFVLFGLKRWRAMAALGPIIVLAALPFISSRRFIMYLAPFAGIGWGLLLCAATQALLRHLATFRAVFNSPRLHTGAGYAAILIVFFTWFAPVAAWKVAPRPAIPTPVFRDLQAMAVQLPADARLWTWWDLGYAISDATPFAVYHDGSAQYTPQTNLIAASFVQSSQQTMHDVIHYVDRVGNRGISQLAAYSANFDDLLVRLRASANPPSPNPVFVLITPDMLLDFPSMLLLGSQSLSDKKARPPLGIRWLNCQQLIDDALKCGPQTFDLRTGWVERQAVQSGVSSQRWRLGRTVIAKSGYAPEQNDFAGGGALTLEIALAGGIVKGVYLLDEVAFESNLNQMFFLGRFNATLFGEAFSDFPYARAYKVLSKPK